MKVLLVGHSFIRRLKNQVLPAARGRDITTQGAGKYFAQKLHLNDRFYSVYTLCERINLVEHLDNLYSQVCQLQPNTVLLDIGSNDLSSFTEVSPASCLKLAAAIFEFAEKLAALPHIYVVIIHSIIPRYSRISATPDIFIKNCQFFNKYIKHFCADSVAIKFSRLQGFFQQLDNTTATPSWTNDGIHCNSTIGCRKYLSRLRHSLLYHS